MPAPSFHILELYEDRLLTYSAREVFEELTPYLASNDPDEMTLTTRSVAMTHLEGTAFYLVPAGELPGTTTSVEPLARPVGIEELRQALAKVMGQ